jgi:hypothetical protein
LLFFALLCSSPLLIHLVVILRDVPLFRIAEAQSPIMVALPAPRLPDARIVAVLLPPSGSIVPPRNVQGEWERCRLPATIILVWLHTWGRAHRALGADGAT